MTTVAPADLARDLVSAYAECRLVSPPTATYGSAFDLHAAYTVEANITRLRRHAGHKTVGRKVGYANKAMWRILKLDTLVWAHMYDDTVRYAAENEASLSLDDRCSPRIEPEVVLKLKRSPEASSDATAILSAVEWMALGFEINDCVFPDWKFQPADFVAAFGLHTALVVGEPCPIVDDAIPELVDRLARFTVRLLRNGELADEGAGKNALRSPALCLAELASAIARQPEADPLEAGEVVSTGTLTNPQPVKSGETWRAEVDGIQLPSLTLRF